MNDLAKKVEALKAYPASFSKDMIRRDDVLAILGEGTYRRSSKGLIGVGPIVPNERKGQQRVEIRRGYDNMEITHSKELFSRRIGKDRRHE